MQSFTKGLDKDQATSQAQNQSKNLQAKITFKIITTQNTNKDIRQATCNANIDIKQESKASTNMKFTYFVHYLDHAAPYIQILK